MKRSIAFAAAVLVALVGDLGAQKPQPTPTSSPADTICWVTMKSESFVRGLHVLLGDIAKVDALDDAVKARASRLELGRMSKPGENLAYTQDTVKRVLDAAGIKGPGVVIDGAQKTDVRSETTPIDADRLEQAARKHLSKALDGKNGVISIAPAQAFATIDVPSAKFRLDLKVEADPKNPLYAGLVNLALVVLVDGEIGGRYALPMIVRRTSDIVIAKRRVAPGRKITIDDLTVENREITRLATDVIESMEESIGLVAVTGLATGQVVLKRDLRPTPVLFRGANITARLRAGRVNVETAAMALEDGAIGEKVLIENPESKRTFYAVVVDSRTVEVAQ